MKCDGRTPEEREIFNTRVAAQRTARERDAAAAQEVDNPMEIDSDEEQGVVEAEEHEEDEDLVEASEDGFDSDASFEGESQSEDDEEESEDSSSEEESDQGF